jgi:ribosomal protein L35AE/L33A
MKYLFLMIVVLVSTHISAQKHTPLPHGMLYGQKVDTLQMMPASRVEAFMGKMVRISTTIKGKVLRVTQTKGVIKVHFKNYGINLPADLRGRSVMIQGVAQKLFIADDMQHFAGDTGRGKKQHPVKADPKQRLMFEATGLVVL